MSDPDTAVPDQAWRNPDAPLPNAAPRPQAELEDLQRIWEPPKGWRFFSVVNNSFIGCLYIGTTLLFLLLAGALALVMRTQLAVPDADVVGYGTYNQLFTMHGTVMMFLFAIPVVEAIAVYLLPAMLAARDLPFPHLSAYAFWSYAAGGLMFFSSLFFGVAPDGGWFMYPPLTSYEYSPGIGADLWLLGIGFIEISAIAGAVELIVGILRTRPPGMSLDKMPVYAWAMLVAGAMIVFGFPPVIAGTMLLELERAFHWPFFIAEQGGDPVLWQHLFWLFGHPEVYVIFLPAAGMVSMMIPTLARTPLVAKGWVVAALIGTAVLSFGLWAHHMFATGMPHMSAGFFSAASMAVAVPSGMQVFAWIATLWRGKVRMTVPTAFVLGFFFLFTLGGLTGVMVAAVPFDWQAHDTYFIVAHLHYVLIGGMVFPMCAALYYWAPTLSGRKLSDKLGYCACALMFVGFNVTFFPMHISGLLGMPRRVYTYAEGLGLEPWNLASTIGAYVLAAGFLLIAIDLILHLRIAGKVRTNPWGASSLEWLPLDNYATRSIPRITSSEPLWDNPRLADEVESGQHFLPGSATGERETIVTSPLEARPQYLLVLPGPSWKPVLAGLGTALFFFALTLKLMWPAVVLGLFTLATIIAWAWSTDRQGHRAPVEIGGGIHLPVSATGPHSHAWWAMVVLLLVSGSIYASLLFAYFFVWTTNPEAPWPPAGTRLPDAAYAFGASGLWVAAGLAIAWTGRQLQASAGSLRRRVIAGSLVATASTAGAFAANLHGLLAAGLQPAQHAYGATVGAILAWQGLCAAVLILMLLFLLARAWTHTLGARSRMCYDCVRLFGYYTIAQGLAGLAVVNVFPRLVN